MSAMEPTKYALTNGVIYTGDEVLSKHCVVVDGATIVEVVPEDELAAGVPRHDLGGLSVAPGFIDIQVNGGGGVLFNDAPEVAAVEAIVMAHRRFGTTSLLPTFITGDTAGMSHALAAVRAWLDARRRGVLGIHFEGPVINPGKAGVHDPRYIRAGAEHDLELFTALPEAKVLVTLAPECAPPGWIAELTERGVLVSLGHSLATFEEARAALDEGATCVTHLFNAMSALQSREPGLVGASLTSDASCCGIIVDGHHVHYGAVEAAWRAKARGDVLLVTDAMPPVGGDGSGFRLGDYDIRVADGRCVTGDGVLAGAALDMATAVRNCVRHVGIPKDEALRMASTYPARFLGVDDRLGRIAPGCDADLVILDDAIEVCETIVGGERSESSQMV